MAERVEPFEQSHRENQLLADEEGGSKPFWYQAVHLLMCVLGIQASYLLWGLMQERIMTKVRWTSIPSA